ncbi:hypothetical protein ANN_20347 [Periplaneta americana]|uniref:Uncharacterized protein n=1 Tax=Periplaneta americana TaxID=6978 RepID=A0ABQ8SCH5_PERAM|nr:hypothetical protein ANN_20347 [Periplaneta americana]
MKRRRTSISMHVRALGRVNTCVEFLAFWLDVQYFHVCVDVSLFVVILLVH